MLAKNKILKIAKIEFLQKGYNGTSLNNIISLTGLSKGGFFYYFRSKDRLLEEVLNIYFKEEVFDVTKNLNGEQDLSEFAKDYLNHFRNQFTQNNYIDTNILAKVSNDIAGQPKSFQVILDNFYRQWEDILTSIIVQKSLGMDFVLEPYELAKLIITFLQGLFVPYQNNKDELRLGEEIASLLKVIKLITHPKVNQPISTRETESNPITPELSNETVFVPDEF